MNHDEQYDKICQPKLETIERKLDEFSSKFEKWAFEGNGKPPINLQIDRLNTFKKVSCWFIGGCTLSIIGVVARLLYDALSKQ